MARLDLAKFKYAVASAGISQRELARRIDCAETVLSSMARGYRDVPDRLLTRIGSFLAVEPQMLIAVEAASCAAAAGSEGGAQCGGGTAS